MSYIITGFLIKLLDIPGAVIGLAGGWFSRSWLHLALTALIGGSAGEITLYLLNDAREFSVIVWLAGVAACFVWAFAAKWIRSKYGRQS